MSNSLLALLVTSWTLASCAQGADPASPRGIAPPTRIPDPIAAAGPAGEPVATASIPPELRRTVVADAAKRFGVDPNSVVLARAERVTWSDGSLGCPEPGMMYTQMLVDGFRVVAKTVEGELVYHTDSRGNARTCGVAGRAGPATRAER